MDIDVMLARRKMAVGTLDALCQALDCRPGELLRWVPADPVADAGAPVISPAAK